MGERRGCQPLNLGQALEIISLVEHDPEEKKENKYFLELIS